MHKVSMASYKPFEVQQEIIPVKILNGCNNSNTGSSIDFSPDFEGKKSKWQLPHLANFISPTHKETNNRNYNGS